MNQMTPGTEIEVPGMGKGIVEGFHGRIEGGRTWMYLLVRFSATLRALVPVYEGVVLQ